MILDIQQLIQIGFFTIIIIFCIVNIKIIYNDISKPELNLSPYKTISRIWNLLIFNLLILFASIISFFTMLDLIKNYFLAFCFVLILYHLYTLEKEN